VKLKNVTVMLEAENLKETVEFYTTLLGFKCVSTYPNTGEACWACVVKDAVELMFTSRNAHSTIEKTTMTGSLYFYPDDVNTLWEELKDKVIVEYPIENFDYGMREFAVRDCNGYLLQFGQEVPGR